MARTKKQPERTAEEKARILASEKLERALDAAYLTYHLFEDVRKEIEPLLSDKEKAFFEQIKNEYLRNVTLGIGVLQGELRNFS